MRLFTFVLLLFFSITNADDARVLQDGVKHYIRTGTVRNDLQQVLSNKSSSWIIDNLSCDACEVGLSSVLTTYRIFKSESVIRSMVTGSCQTLKFGTKEICNGLINPMLDIFFYVAQRRPDLSSSKMCSLLMSSSCLNQFNFFNWNIPIPDRNESIPKKKKTTSSKTIRILHLTDLHVDPRYATGGKAICKEPLCCQNDGGVATNPEEACGPWGDYRSSDLPMRTFTDALANLKTQKVDYVYFTGDIIPRRVWSTSVADNSQLERTISDMIKSNFKVPTFFVLGNHEAHPVNGFAPLSIDDAKLNSKWIYDILKEEVSGIAKTVEAGGFYTVLLPNKLRLVVLNNNVYDTNNLWLLYEDHDIYGQLQWLTDVLGKAEAAGERVHLLYHIPTADEEFLGVWGREFTRIINRYSDTIAAQFNGHTHFDEFFLFYDGGGLDNATSVAFNGAALTPYVGSNPSYKIYEVDSESFEVVNFEEWTFNLAEANSNRNATRLKWYKLYSFKETYGVPSLKPQDLNDFVQKMAMNRTLLNTYNNFKYRLGTATNAVCDDNCHRDNLCRIVTSSIADKEHCLAIKKLFDQK